MDIDKKKAKMIYPSSPEWFQKELEKEFGVEYFTPNYYEKLGTVEDCCARIGVDPKSMVREGDTDDEIAYRTLKVVIQAINTNEKGIRWEPDWKNTNQKKWFPVFNLSSGFGFSRSSYHYGNADADVGSRLVFETKEQSDYAATNRNFLDLYKRLITIQK